MRPLLLLAGGMAKWYEAPAEDEAVIQIFRAFLTVPIVSSRARQVSTNCLAILKE
jgi:hypothetical protein